LSYASVLFGLFGAEGLAAAQRVGLRDTPPARRGKHCLGDQDQKLILEHYVAGSINPLGLENQLRLSLCTPLIETPGLLYDFTNVEFGLANYISPTHVHGGDFGTNTPKSFLTLKAEVTGFFIWPLGDIFPGAGVIGLRDPGCRVYYDDIYGPKDPSVSFNAPTDPSSGFGVRTLLGAALQGAVPLHRRLDLLVYNGFNSEYWRYNTDQCVYVARRDVGIHGSGDWILANTAVLALAIKVHPNHTIRVGATDDLVYTPSNGYLGNLAAGLISYGVDNLRGLARSFAFFVRLGTFTNGFRKDGPIPDNHCAVTAANPTPMPCAAGVMLPAMPTSGTSLLTIALGLDVYYELTKRPTRRSAQIPLPGAEPSAPAKPSEPAVEPTPAVDGTTLVPEPAPKQPAPADEVH
jgi:hypothetical protein